MAWNLPPLAVTGSTIPAAWGNATRDSLLETAPGQVTDKGQIFWASADGEVSPLAPPSGTGTGYLVINRGTGVVSWGLGTFATAQIPNLAASKITSGAFDTARIPDLGANKITSGAFSTNRIPNLGADKITFGTFDTGRIPTNIPAASVNGFSFEDLTQAAYDALTTPDADTVYLIP